jgi:protein O-GlcNAc transferase
MLEIAVKHHQAGDLRQAEQIYRQILERDPNDVNALNLLGVLCSQQGQHELGVGFISEAIRRKPEFAGAYNNLGNVRSAQGQLAEAVAAYRQALVLRPGYARAQSNLGLALLAQKEFEAAIASFRQAILLEPLDAEPHYSLGLALTARGALEEAIACYRQAIQLRPDYVDAIVAQGNGFRTQGNRPAAIECYRLALRHRPSSANAYLNLGAALQENGEPTEAIACYQRVLKLEPDNAAAHNNLGNALKDQGRMEEALASYRKALELKPDFADAHSNLLYTLMFCPGYDAAAIFEEHRRWNDQHAAPLAKEIRPHGNERSPGRRLRVGYVSPNFRDQAEAFFTVPLLSAHDHQQFEIFCYSAVASPDALTARLRGCADVWRDIAAMTDEQAAELIRADAIDVLVDLTMHMGPRNHLLVFARKPAPVQMCWLAYQGTTGLATMDYRLTDQHIDPIGLDDRFYAEESIRLADSFWCYDPLTTEPSVGPLPALARNHITFGSLNNFCKVNAEVLRLWARVLRAVDGSRLLLLAADGPHRQRALEIVEQAGVAPERVAFAGKQPRPRYLELYHQIDIGLDTFPYNGQTTTLDAFWLGVPVITIVGQTAVARSGASLLRCVGLPELVAATPDQFVRIAIELADDLLRLGQLRAALRDRLRNSRLMDAPRFARAVESAYRSAWERWRLREELGTAKAD